ncbi:Putative type II secretion system protein D precursor [Planctomycetes bacterium Poly30]|uniref:Type II secretion system protein D n=1 Tax=Saltatorellus ferox TaxID=2528018 RepID=A0A518ESR8_9BACT|nr:Putative type II secretion system protein D precursor [Planctomycetes bacterium Poly30]
MTHVAGLGNAEKSTVHCMETPRSAQEIMMLQANCRTSRRTLRRVIARGFSRAARLAPAPLALAFLWALPLTLVSAAGAAAAPQQNPQQDTADLATIVEVEGSYVLNFAQSEEEDSMSLYQFTQACQEVTDLQFTWNQDTEGLLKQNKVRLLGQKTIKKDRFYSFFQVMMIISDFVCTEVGEDDIAVIKIDSLTTTARNNLRSGAIYVEPENLADYQDQPATLITTVVTLPNTDVRQVSNSMRTMITDANTQQMLPAGNSNSMVLVGFGSNVVALANMLSIIDEASKSESPTPEFEMIKLEYAVPDDVAAMVEELLEAANQAKQQNAAVQGAQGTISRNQGEAKIIVDARTNSLIIVALPEEMPRIKELIARLDVDIVERERSYHIVGLENVSAEDLAETLNDFLEDAVQLDQQAGGTAGNNQRNGGAQRSSNNAREFVVVADNETNSLLIAANRTRYQDLKGMIELLDRRQDQVLIETALIELTSRDMLDIGVELGFADIPGTDQTGGFGVTGFGLSTLEDSDGDGVVDVRVPSLGQGVTAGIIDGGDFSIPMLLALVEEKRNSNVLNVPSVLVNNNSVATVSTLDEQPTTQITATGGGVGAGQTQTNFNGYQEAGITMEISPSISASRYLRLDIYLEVSTFIGSVQGAIPPPRVTRTIRTQVNVPDGATMVIGGIVVDNESDTRTQVPVLGDIPILGRLFSRESSNRDRTVLYFFVTPHIMKDTEFADLAEFSFTKKLEAAEQIGMDRLRKIDPNFGAPDGSGSDVSLEGFDLPLYSAPIRGEVEGEDVGITPFEAASMLDGTKKE